VVLDLLAEQEVGLVVLALCLRLLIPGFEGADPYRPGRAYVEGHRGQHTPRRKRPGRRFYRIPVGTHQEKTAPLPAAIP
jgi:hypothetical protein